jgi:tetratricopeptide (TPR) repeat protein/S1-C subfamily serine protease
MKTHNLLIALTLSTFTMASILPWTAAAQESTESIDNRGLTVVTAKQAAAKITVKIGIGQGVGSGVLLAKKGSTYLVLTNSHVLREQTGVTIYTPDAQVHVARRVQNAQVGDFDLALLEFNSAQAYHVAKFTNFENRGAMLNEGREVFAAGFSYDVDGLKLLEGKITQLPQEAFKNGTQIGYVTQGNLIQGMSGGPVLDSNGDLVGINSTLARPIIDNYVYTDGRKAPPDKVAEYREANWSVPMYNLLTRLNPDILHSYEQLPRLQPVITPTGFMAELDRKARSVTVRIEHSANGSGVIIAKKGNVYYVLTANHVIRNDNKKIKENLRLVTPDQKTYDIISSEISPLVGVDLAIVKFTSSRVYDIAKLGNYGLRGGYYVFPAGWPARERINSQQWQWQINPGGLQGQRGRKDADFRLNDYSSFDSGYDIIHSSITYAGMSGGPIFDIDGQVIGIHGQTEGNRYEMNPNSLRNSLGISVRSFLRSANQLGLNPSDLHISTVFPRELTSTDLISLIKVAWNTPIPGKNASSDEWIEYGTQLFRTERYPEAVKAFEQAIVRKPNSIDAYIGKSLAFPNMNRNYHAALEATNRAIDLVSLGDQPKFYYLWRMRGSDLKKLKRYEEALVATNYAINLNQQDIISLYDKGVLLSILKRYPEAIIVYSQIITKEKKHFWAYVGRGEVKNLMGDYEGAMADLDIAININPEYAESYSYRGWMKVSRKNNKAAIADLDIAINIDPENAKAHSTRGIAKFSQAMTELIEEGTSVENSFKSHQDQTKYEREISLVRKKFKARSMEARQDIANSARFYLLDNNQEGYGLAMDILKSWPEYLR